MHVLTFYYAECINRPQMYIEKSISTKNMTSYSAHSLFVEIHVCAFQKRLLDKFLACALEDRLTSAVGGRPCAVSNFKNPV